MNRTVEKIKKIGGSPVLLIAIICFTAGVVANIISLILQSVDLTNLGNEIVAVFGGSEELNQLMASFSSAFALLPITTIVSSSFSLVTILGLWMFFAACKSTKPRPSLVGLSLIKIVKIVELIAIIVTFVGAVVLTFSVLFGISSLITSMAGENNTVFIIVSVIVLAIMIIATVLTISYYSGILRTIKAIRMTVNTGVIMGKVSLYVIIANYFIAAFMIVNAVLSPSIYILISGLFTAVACVLLSVAMSSLRSEMAYIASRGSSAID